MKTREGIKEEIKGKEAELEGLKKDLTVAPDVLESFEQARDTYCTYCGAPLYIVRSESGTFTCLNDDCERLGVVVVMWTTDPEVPQRVRYA